MPRDLSLPEEYAFNTRLALSECHARLTSALAEESASAARETRSSRVTGQVNEGGFELEQHVIPSPLGGRRVARGRLSQDIEGTRVGFHLEVTNYPFSDRGPQEWRMLKAVRTILSAEWKQFDAEETRLITVWLRAALSADEAPVRCSIALAQQPSAAGSDSHASSVAVRPIDWEFDAPDFAAALDAALAESDGETAPDTVPARYVVVIEPTETGYSAYIPDLLGCVATGMTVEEVEQNLSDAVALHLEGLVDDGIGIPESRALALLIEMPVMPLNVLDDTSDEEQ